MWRSLSQALAKLLHGRDWLVQHAMKDLLYRCTLPDTIELRDAKVAAKKLVGPVNAVRLLAFIIAKSAAAARRLAEDRKQLYTMVEFITAVKRIYVQFGAAKAKRGQAHKACIHAYADLFQTLVKRTPYSKAVSLAAAHLRRFGVVAKRTITETPAEPPVVKHQKAVETLQTEINDLLKQMVR